MRDISSHAVRGMVAASLVVALVVGALGITAAHAAEPMSVDEMKAFLPGTTHVGFKGREVFAVYYAPDGTTRMKVKVSGAGISKHPGTYWYDDQGRMCSEFPGKSFGDKKGCRHIVPMDDGRYKYTDGAVIKKIVEGEQTKLIR